MKAPAPPPGYRAPSAWERRTVKVMDNRRRSWLLELAKRRGKLPTAKTPNGLVLHVRQHLPDLFGDLPRREVIKYVSDQSDRAIAETVLAAGPPRRSGDDE